MKKIITLLIIFCSLTGCYQRIGDLTMISNRNINTDSEYVLLQRNVEGKAKMKKDDALERAIDDATEAHNGEYLMNVKVYVKNNGKYIKVVGDVWGTPSVQTNVSTSVEIDNKLEVGDQVTFKSGTKLVEGKILGINQNGAIVEFKSMSGQMKKKEVAFGELTKIEK